MSIDLIGVTKDSEGNPKLKGIFYGEDKGGIVSSGNNHTLYGIEKNKNVSAVVFLGCTYPVVDFDDTFTCPNVAFVDASPENQGIISWLWDFGDETSSTEQNPTHEYAGSGTYTVSLTTKNECGAEKTYSTDITINFPIAGFSGTPLSGESPLSVTFTDSSQYADSYNYDFGDGSADSQEQNPVHEFTTDQIDDILTITQTVTQDGCQDIEEKTDYVTVYNCPVADFSATPLTGTEPLTVNFTNLSTFANDYDWVVGAQTSELENPSFILNAGTYNAQLTAANGYCNDVELKSSYIVVDAAGGCYWDDDFESYPQYGDMDWVKWIKPTNWGYTNFAESTIRDITIYDTLSYYYLTTSRMISIYRWAREDISLNVTMSGDFDVQVDVTASTGASVIGSAVVSGIGYGNYGIGLYRRAGFSNAIIAYDATTDNIDTTISIQAHSAYRIVKTGTTLDCYYRFYSTADPTWILFQTYTGVSSGQNIKILNNSHGLGTLNGSRTGIDNFKFNLGCPANP